MCCGLGVTMAVASLLAQAAPAATGEPGLEEVLAQAGRYVVGYEQTLSMVTAEEEFRQRLRVAAGGPVHDNRTLRSDVVFVRLEGTSLPWFLFRDVYEVDGHAVRDRQARLEKLFLQAPADTLARARAIADEGARFNLGQGTRNFNVPTFALIFLHPSVQPRFAFERRGLARIDGREFVEVAFRETSSPTLIRQDGRGGDVFATGRAWIAPGDGTVARTEMTIDATGEGVVSTSSIETTYRPLPALAFWAPVQMQERWETLATGARGRSGAIEHIDGIATYRNFGRVKVTTEEEFKLPH
jgi:hypothetical protein